MNTYIMILFFRYEWENDVNNVMKKITIKYVLKRLFVKAITAFTSIYFESCWKIPARSNKSILYSFYYKIHVHIKGILKYNKQV